MSGFVFDENLSRKDFGSLRDKKGIKTHFLGSYAWGEVSGSGNWIPYYTGVRKKERRDRCDCPDTSEEARGRIFILLYPERVHDGLERYGAPEIYD